MKKFAAIVLFCLYTFNLFGYLLLFHLMEQRAEERLQTSLNQETYLENDLITLTVPLSLPYVTDTQGFERVDGEITLKGKIYHYVKRAIKNGAYVLLCLPDHGKMKLENSKAEYFKLTGDFQQARSSKKNGSKAELFKDMRLKYTQQFNDAANFALPIVSIEVIPSYTLHPVYRQKALPDQPPEHT